NTTLLLRRGDAFLQLDRRRFGHLEFEALFAVLLDDPGLDRAAAGEVATQETFGQRVLEQILDGSAERTGAELEARTLVDDELLRLVGQFEFEALVLEPFADLAELDVDDLLEIVARQAAEDDDVIE